MSISKIIFFFLKRVKHPAKSGSLLKVLHSKIIFEFFFSFWGCGCNDVHQIRKHIHPPEKVIGNSEFLLWKFMLRKQIQSFQIFLRGLSVCIG